MQAGHIHLWQISKVEGHIIKASWFSAIGLVVILRVHATIAIEMLSTVVGSCAILQKGFASIAILLF